MSVEPGSDEERLILGRWIKMGQSLIIASSALGESYVDPNVKRDGELGEKNEEYNKFDREVAEKVPHLKGKFRYEVETYFRDNWGPYLPKE